MKIAAKLRSISFGMAFTHQALSTLQNQTQNLELTLQIKYNFRKFYRMQRKTKFILCFLNSQLMKNPFGLNSFIEKHILYKDVGSM